ncbi:MAG TPA: hypothetical protein VNA24_02010 [Hyalangium sp.]|nr:hypothetical protein [Hyalangium sp.]
MKSAAFWKSLAVVDSQLAADTPNGRFWRRYDFDGYGETREGGPWEISEPDTGRTLGRAWPFFAGERGEYALASGQPADTWLAAQRGRLPVHPHLSQVSASALAVCLQRNIVGR